MAKDSLPNEDRCEATGRSVAVPPPGSRSSARAIAESLFHVKHVLRDGGLADQAGSVITTGRVGFGQVPVVADDDF